jgi:hypothetical protein
MNRLHSAPGGRRWALPVPPPEFELDDVPGFRAAREEIQP